MSLLASINAADFPEMTGVILNDVMPNDHT